MALLYHPIWKKESPMVDELTLQAVYAARHAIAGYVRRTPLIRAEALSARTGRAVYFKLENQQETGAFKVRGAANRLLALTAGEHAAGVVTVSTGNHGRAVAWVGRRLGMRVVVCVPELVLPHKVAAIRRLGAEIVIHGANQDEAEAHALTLARGQGLTLISPFDDPWVIAGQGTIGLEVLEELPDTTTVVSPLSGGGLLGGIALAVKAVNPAIRTVGVSMDRGPAMIESLAAGHPVQLPEEPTLADSLMGGIGLENRYTFDLIRRTVDDTVVLSEAEIAAAMTYALCEERQIVEGGGAVALGAVLHEKAPLVGDTIVIILSGGNVDMGKLIALAQED
jgi:threonine dehydratase